MMLLIPPPPPRPVNPECLKQGGGRALEIDLGWKREGEREESAREGEKRRMWKEIEEAMRKIERDGRTKRRVGDEEMKRKLERGTAVKHTCCFSRRTWG